MGKQIRSDLLQDVYVDNGKETKYYKEFSPTSHWICVPESFKELRMLLLDKLQKLNVQLFDTGIRKGFDGEVWVKGICFREDRTIAVRMTENNIRTIMVGVDWLLMWEMISSILNIYLKEQNNENKGTED